MIGTGRERDEALITVLGESMPRGTTKRQHTRCGLFLSTYVFFESVEHLVEVVGHASPGIHREDFELDLPRPVPDKRRVLRRFSSPNSVARKEPSSSTGSKIR